MRGTKYVALVIVGILAGACGSDPPPPPVAPPAPTVASTPEPPPAPVPTPDPPPPAKPSMAEMQMKTLKAWGENISDPSKLAMLVTDDVKMSFAGMPDAVGKDNALKGHAGFADAMTDMKTGAWRVWQKDNVAIVEWVNTGTFSKDWMGMKATNKPFGINGATVAWFNDDGLIKEQHVYVDVPTMMSQLGVSKQKARPVAALPSGAPEMHTSKGSDDEAKNIAVVKTIAAAFDAKKDTDFLAALDDGGDYEAFSAPMISKGKADAKKYFQMFSKAFPDSKGTASNMWGFDDVVIDESTMTGTQKGPLGPLKASNKPVTTHALEILKLTNGKIVHGWNYSNSAELLMQIGVMPMPGAMPKAEGPKAPAPKASSPAKPTSKK